jgi:hypothetical protein
MAPPATQGLAVSYPAEGATEVVEGVTIKHHYLDNQGVKIHYVETGKPTGQPVLLLHGDLPTLSHYSNLCSVPKGGGETKVRMVTYICFWIKHRSEGTELRRNPSSLSILSVIRTITLDMMSAAYPCYWVINPLWIHGYTSLTVCSRSGPH